MFTFHCPEYICTIPGTYNYYGNKFANWCFNPLGCFQFHGLDVIWQSERYLLCIHEHTLMELLSTHWMSLYTLWLPYSQYFMNGFIVRFVNLPIPYTVFLHCFSAKLKSLSKETSQPGSRLKIKSRRSLVSQKRNVQMFLKSIRDIEISIWNPKRNTLKVTEAPLSW